MALPQEEVQKYDVVLLPIDYTSNSTPNVQFAMDGHLGNNRFSISLSLRRDEFATAYEKGDYNSCETIATDIVNTLCREYKGRLLEVVSTNEDWTFTDIGYGCEAVERVKFALQYPPQSPFSPPVCTDNDLDCEEDEDYDVAAFTKDALHPNIFDDDNDVIDNTDEHPTPPHLETFHSFDSIPVDFYKAFEPRPECLETNSISSVASNTVTDSSVTSNTVSTTSIPSSVGNQDTKGEIENNNQDEKSSSVDKPSLMEDSSIKKDSCKKAAKVKSTTETAIPNRRKKRVIQRRGLLKFNTDTKSNPDVKIQVKQRTISKVSVNLGDSRFAVDPTLSKMLNRAASEGHGTDITDLYTTNSYCESIVMSTASEPKRQKVIHRLRETLLSKLKVGKGNTKHYSSSEVDIMENDKTVKCLDQNEFREISPYDVFCRTEPNHDLVTETTHVGNSRLKIMMMNHREKYHSTCSTKADKRSILSSLVSEVVNGEKGIGKFIAKESEDCGWYELDEEGACLVVEGSLGKSEHDMAVLNLPDPSLGFESKDKLPSQANLMGGLHNAALMNLKNRKKKRILSSKLKPESIDDLQKQMLDTSEIQISQVV
mmetsp:Transcript_29342/g.34913  ORF Transcript_29342/g.34913 Transcript_29342/m.34913 type:complete len:598 (-) Transcript_29342:175-1968(-)